MTDLPVFDADADIRREAEVAETTRAMKEAGVPVETKAAPKVNYWGFGRMEKFFLPDGVQYIEFRPMTEADRQHYQNNTQAVLSLNRASGDSKLPLNQARDRKALLAASVKGWYFFGPDGAPVDFKHREFGWDKWVAVADPQIIDALEKAIRKANPWMQSDMDKDEIRKQIDELEDLLRQKEEEEAGELASSDK